MATVGRSMCLTALGALSTVSSGCTEKALETPQTVSRPEASEPGSIAPIRVGNDSIERPRAADFNRELLLSVIRSSNSALALNSYQVCVESEPAIQFLENRVVSIQYVQGCGDYDKKVIGQYMWRLAQEYLRACANLEDPPPLKIQAVTRNGGYIFSSMTPTDTLRKIRAGEYDINKWMVKIASNKKRLAPLPEEIAHLNRLGSAVASRAPPATDLGEELRPLLEDLECVDEVTSLTTDRRNLRISFMEGCGEYREIPSRLIMYDMALRIIRSLDEAQVSLDVELTARTKNGGYYYKQVAPAQILQGISEREIGIVDWVEQRYRRQ